MDRFTWRTGAVVLGVALVVLIGMITLASGTQQKKEPHPAKPEPAAPIHLEFAVWGNATEIATYQAVVDDYNATSKGTKVSVVSWPDAATMEEAVRAGTAHPDLYMLPRADLAEAISEKRTVPLLDLLNERKIPIGDDFSRDSIEAFSVNDDLQCLPYTSSPMVIYYNTDLVDFAAMEAEGLPVPKSLKSDKVSWNFAEFRAAAEFGSRPRRNTRGIYVEPTLRGLAPFVYSGGGQLFDDERKPTSLTLSDDTSTDALRQTLELLRDTRYTLSAAQLEQRPPVEWFRRGKLAMLAGFRNLTPEFRAKSGLNFDVMPMPSMGSAATVGDLDGICLSPGKPARTEASANFLTYLVSDEVLARVAATGYLQPAKLTVALSSDFLQPDQMPASSAVFNQTMKNIRLSPLMPQITDLRALINPEIKTLLTTPDIADLQASLRAIDELSRTLLDPDYVAPTDSATEGPSGSPSQPASGTPSPTASGD